MPNCTWDDPFGVYQDSSGQTYWMGGKGFDHKGNLWSPDLPAPSPELAAVVARFVVTPPPVDLGVIRKRQRALLPQIIELRTAADQALGQIRGNPAFGGGSELELELTARKMLVMVCYRLSYYPHILQQCFPQTVSDHAVVLPVNKKPRASILDSLFPLQHVTDIDPEAEQHWRQVRNDARNALSLIQKPGVLSDTASEDRIIVYPRVLEFVARLIQNIGVQIFDFQFCECGEPSDLLQRSSRSTPGTSLSLR